MDVQVQELIEKIKRDGIESASASAEKVLADAKSEAERIVKAAEKQARDVLAKAEADSERFRAASEAALEQASRNLVLAFRSKMEKMLDSVVAAKVAEALNQDLLQKILPSIVTSWNKGEDISVLLSADDLKQSEAFFKKELAAELSKGLEIKVDESLDKGFRIASKDGAAYWDFSADALASMLSSYLNPRLSAILSDAIKDM